MNTLNKPSLEQTIALHRSILSGVGELLNPEQKKWAKQHLRKETLFLLRTAAF